MSSNNKTSEQGFNTLLASYLESPSGEELNYAYEKSPIVRASLKQSAFEGLSKEDALQRLSSELWGRVLTLESRMEQIQHLSSVTPTA